MTARVNTLKGADAGLYYVDALPSYYFDSGEPKGLWHGSGAEVLGLEGEIIDDEFLSVMSGLHPRAAGDAPLGRRYGEASVRGFDVTASAPKSVSTLFAIGDEHTRGEVLAAHDAAVGAALEWVEAQAHTRFRIDGEVAVVDAEGIVAATFRQHTSRALDPQLHTHIVIANKVRSPDGRWLALDARSLKMDQRTVSAIYHATLRSGMTARLGVDWQPVVNGIAEVDGVADGVLDEFSARTADVQRRIDEKLDRFIDDLDRSPTPRERWRLEREAVLDSRPAKVQDVQAAELHREWGERVEALGLDQVEVVQSVVGHVRGRPLQRSEVTEVLSKAIGALQSKQSSWRPAELTREIAAAMPTDVTIDPVVVRELLDSMTKLAVERCVDISRPIPESVARRRDGRPVTESIADRVLSTSSVLAQEERLLAWAERRMSRIGVDSAEAVDRATVQLTGPQAETAAAVAGDADLVIVVGPAGTGKTTALAPAAEQLLGDGRAAFGVAPSATAAEVLTTETGIDADTIDKLLIEHDLDRPPGHRYDLPVGATVIVDEAGMVPTDRLDALAQLADDRGWRVALVGDPMQFAAVGRGGMFEHLINAHGAIELDKVHRFSNDWERDASLQLRRGDTSVAEIYEREGRLHSGTASRMTRDALDTWWTARQQGETVVLAAPTNETVAKLNRAAQQRRIDAGEIDLTGRYVDAGGYQLRRGDQVATRRNHRELRTDQGVMIRNRDIWTIEQVYRNGDLTIGGDSGLVTLPADYVKSFVELAYAQTSHATQGRTVDRSILVVDGATDVRGIYVPMTRGRHHNDAYIVTRGEETTRDLFAEAISRNWIDQPAVARRAELAGQDLHRPGTLPPLELRSLLDQQAELSKALAEHQRDLDTLPRELKWVRNEERSAAADLEQSHAELGRAAATLDEHDRPFRRRGNETAIARAKQAVELLPARIDAQADRLRSSEGRVDELEQRLANARQFDIGRPALQTQLNDIDGRLNDDRGIRSRQIRRELRGRIVDALGARPAGGEPALRWDHAAGQLDQHQTAFDLTDGLGPTRGRRLPVGFLHSRSLVERAQDQARQSIGREKRQTLERSGIGMDIGL